MMTGFEQYTRKTRRVIFLEEMEQVVPWRELCGLVEPHYPKPGNGRPPVGVERMLRIYFLQQWFNLSDPAVEEALYDSAVMRQFVGIDLGCEPVPDETTVCKFRHLLEEHQLGEQILGQVNLHLQAQGVRITTGTIVDATILHAPTSTKNREQQRDPEMHQTKKGKQWYFGMKAHVGVDSKTKIIHTAGGDGGQRRRFGGAAGSIARRRNASVGRSGLSRTDRSDPEMRASGPGLHPSALPLQESY
jgi:IS5 family transposase